MEKHKILMTFSILVILMSCSNETLSSNYEASSDSIPSHSISSEMSIESETDKESSFVDSGFSEDSSSEEIIETFNPYDKHWTYEGNYYDSLDFSLTDDDMKKALSNLINTGVENSSYSGLRSAYKYTDVDPQNENNIILYYTGESRAFKYGDSSAFQESINREHVWPQSRYASLGKKQHNTPYDDIYNVRPSDKNANSSRGNGLFDYGLNEPENDNYKGDVARVLFYVATRYTTLSLVDNTTGGSNSMGKLSTLLEWNLKYPVTDVEIRRNNGGEKVQKNRNPFVDNPHFACAIWGSTNDATRKVCQSSFQEKEIASNTIVYKDYFSSFEKNDIYALIESKKRNKI